MTGMWLKFQTICFKKAWKYSERKRENKIKKCIEGQLGSWKMKLIEMVFSESVGESAGMGINKIRCDNEKSG